MVGYSPPAGGIPRGLRILVGAMLALTLAGEGGACPDSSLIVLESLHPGAVLRGARSVAVNDDAAALLLNPAALLSGRGPTARLEVLGAEAGETSAWSLVGGTGSFALGWQRARNADGSRALKRFLLGASIEASPSVRLGVSYAWNRTYGETGDRWTRLSGGVLWRPRSVVSLGVTADNLNRPSLAGDPQERRYTLGLGVRPFTDRVTFMLDAWADEDRLSTEEIDLRWGASLEPIDGVLLGASFSDQGHTIPGKPSAEITVGLNLTKIGFSWSGRRERSGEAGGVRDRSFSLLLSSRRQRTSFRAQRQVASLDLGGELVDGEPGFSLFGGRRQGMAEVRRIVRGAAADPSVGALLVKIAPLSAGALGGFGGLAQEVREEILNAREAGLPVVSFIEGSGWGAEYYLAAAADWVVLAPSGVLGGMGTSIDIVRYRELGEKLGIKWDLETVGRQKDTFYGQSEAPGEEQLETVRRLADGIYQELLDGVGESRGVSREELEGFSEGELIGSRRAKELNLVDHVGHREDAVLLAARAAGLSPDDADDVELLDVSRRRYRDYHWGPPDRVAVIEIRGTIVSGRSERSLLGGSEVTGAETVARRLREVRRDDSIKAMVLRVDSGGGSGMASDAIWREVQRVREAGKPVVVSMADVAASGGYYISMSADYVYAHPATITGSIGGASLKTNLAGFYEKIGLSHQVVKRGEYADMFSSSRSWTEEERAMIHASLEDFQEEFIRRVSRDRRLPIEEVRAIAEGQVFTGAEAHRLGLVDALGGLSDAVEMAQMMAGIKESQTVMLSDRGSGWNEAWEGVTRVLWR